MNSVNSAINPKDGIEYFVGDKVVIYQGRFGHNNIIQIKSIWINETESTIINTPYVSSSDSLPGTYISAIKRKISDKEINLIRKAKSDLANFEKYNINF